MLRKHHYLSGLVLILIGVYFLAKNFVPVPFEIPWRYVWPIVLIVWGGYKIAIQFSRTR